MVSCECAASCSRQSFHLTVQTGKAASLFSPSAAQGEVHWNMDCVPLLNLCVLHNSLEAERRPASQLQNILFRGRLLRMRSLNYHGSQGGIPVGTPSTACWDSQAQRDQLQHRNYTFPSMEHDVHSTDESTEAQQVTCQSLQTEKWKSGGQIQKFLLKLRIPWNTKYCTVYRRGYWPDPLPTGVWRLHFCCGGCYSTSLIFMWPGPKCLPWLHLL